MKLSEVLIKNQTVFTVTVGDLTKDLKMGKLSLKQLAQYESEGIALENIFELLNKDKVTWLTRICYDLLALESKAEFDNSLDIFRECLGPEQLKVMAETVTTVMTESLPKNDQSEPLK
jgi:hypothetical protein